MCRMYIITCCIFYSSWSNILSMCKDDFITQSSKWWFHLYGLVNEEKDKLSESDAVTSLQSFIETSSLGDYSDRLKMIESFGLQLREGSLLCLYCSSIN